MVVSAPCRVVGLKAPGFMASGCGVDSNKGFFLLLLGCVIVASGAANKMHTVLRVGYPCRAKL